MIVPNLDTPMNNQAAQDYKNGTWAAKAKQLTLQHAKWFVKFMIYVNLTILPYIKIFVKLSSKLKRSINIKFKGKMQKKLKTIELESLTFDNVVFYSWGSVVYIIVYKVTVNLWWRLEN